MDALQRLPLKLLILERIKRKLLPMIVRKSKQKQNQYTRHKQYLKKIKYSSLFCPRYDMLSLNNNLLLHRNYDPKKQLVPHKPSANLRELDQQIKRKTMAKVSSKNDEKPAAKWYESVLRDAQVGQKRFKFEYFPANSNGFSVRESLNRLYSKGKTCSRGKNGSFSHAPSGRLE